MRSIKGLRCPCEEFKICAAINKKYALGTKSPKCKSKLSDNCKKPAGY